MKTCPSCGTQNKQENSACCNCFSPLDQGAVARPSSAGKQVAKRVEKPRVQSSVKSGGGGAGRFIGIFLVVIIIACAGYGGYTFFLKPTPEKTIKQLISAMEKGDLDMALNCFSNDTVSFINSTGLPAAANKAKAQAGSQFNLPGSNGKNPFDVKIDSCAYIDPDHATVAITSTLSLPSNPFLPGMQQAQNKSIPASVPMLREDGKWKIDGMKWIDNGLRSMSDADMRQLASMMQLFDGLKGMMATQGVHIDPVVKLLDTEIKRRNIDPASVPAFKMNMPFPMNMPK